MEIDRARSTAEEEQKGENDLEFDVDFNNNFSMPQMFTDPSHTGMPQANPEEEEKKGTPDGGSNSMPFQPSDSTVAGGGPAVGLGIDSNPFGFGGTPGVGSCACCCGAGKGCVFRV